MIRPTKAQVGRAIDKAIEAVAKVNGGLSEDEKARLHSYIDQPRYCFGTWEYHGQKCPAAYAGMDREAKITKEFATAFDEEMAKVTHIGNQEDGSMGAASGRMGSLEGETAVSLYGGPTGR